MVRWYFALVFVLAASLVTVPAHAAYYPVDSFFDIYCMYGGPWHVAGSGMAAISADKPLPGPGESGVINVQLLSLDVALTGGPPELIIRESPTLMSSGQWAYTSDGGGGGGGYHIDSFFDIFFELSLDGGQSWWPSQTCGHYTGTCESFFDIFVELEVPMDLPGCQGQITNSGLHFYVPEPCGLLAVAVGFLPLAARMRRYRTAK